MAVLSPSVGVGASQCQWQPAARTGWDRCQAGGVCGEEGMERVRSGRHRLIRGLETALRHRHCGKVCNVFGYRV